MALATTTELDAINTMLSTIGEAPINSLAGAAGVVDAVMARQVLREVAVQVQEEAWQFNTEKNVTLVPDLSNSFINIPLNAVRVDSTGKDEGIDVTVRGTRLYNKDDHSYTFTQNLLVDMVILLEFEEMPQAARHYIMIRAARIFQKRAVGSDMLDSFSNEDEMRGRAALLSFEGATADHNMLTGSRHMNNILGRR